MVHLVDTNIIIRFLVGDHEEHLQKATDIFRAVESGEMEVIILDVVLMEAFFVLTRFYQLPVSEVVDDLKALLTLKGVVNTDKFVLFETLSLVDSRKTDFVDALILAKSKLQGYGTLSFDKDVTST